MELIQSFISENEVMLVVISSIITFFVGRYTCHLDDRRNGMKDINETFYKPFLSTYMNEHHAYALFFTDLSIKGQKKMVKLLLDNSYRVAPIIKEKIVALDCCFSGYLEDIEEKKELLQEEKEYVERCFGDIYTYIEKQYRKNERRLYCSMFKRFLYKMQEILIECNIWKVK